MTASGVYAFNPPVTDIVQDALERCGIAPPLQTAQMVKSALYSFNMALIDLANMQINLWTVNQAFIPLTEGQATYTLPTGAIDALEVTLRESTRELDGTPASSAGGTAANAFDGDFATACTQTSTDGNISYQWDSGVQKTITMVGLRSNSTTTYTLVWEGSNDGSAWTALLTQPATAYTVSVTQWYAIVAPDAYQYMRVRETGGGTLNVQELYFNVQSSDLLLSRLSRSEYVAIPQKTQTGRPTSFYVDRQISPTITFWNTPDDTVSMIYYTYIRQVQTTTAANQTTDLPYRFIEALTAHLATKLAVKYALQRVEALQRMAELSYKLAADEDRERVTMTMIPDCG